MKKTNITQRFRSIALFLFLITMPSWIFAAENPYLDSISRALEASTFPRTEQAEVHAKAAAAVRAGVPAEDVQIIVSRAVRRGAEAGIIKGFLDTILAAKKEGVPVGPVLDRIEQGLSKGAPTERIAAASRQLAQKLVDARPLVEVVIHSGMRPERSNEREEAIEAAARALEKAIPPQAIEGMGSAVREKQGSLPLFTSAINTVTYFVGSGMSPKTASNLVRNAVEKRYSVRDLDAMVKRINEEMRRGARAEDVAARMERDAMSVEQGMGRPDMQTDRGMGAGSGRGGPRR
jgi:hypothetical protein